ncbi:MAG: 30S ribosomal protein S8 [Deltaproteobacteria bacterium]|nr:30S ribosomal protein S8 [Deltaproteobacteria bacterium]
MGVNDPIADMLTRIRNANRNKDKEVDVLLSKINKEICRVLKESGYIKGYEVKRDSQKKHHILRIYLKYTETRERVVCDVQRVSKLGRRIYGGSSSIPKVLNGFGVAILSTSKGIMTDKQAMALKVGGEILCNVW